MLYAVADNITRRLPKIISPKGHAMADYVVVGAFVLAGGLFWRSNKRAATAAFLCGGAELALSLVTDYPGGAMNVLSFSAHGKADIGLAAVIATMPELLGFRNGRKFFLAQSAAITATANLTQFNQAPKRLMRKRPRIA